MTGDTAAAGEPATASGFAPEMLGRMASAPVFGRVSSASLGLRLEAREEDRCDMLGSLSLSLSLRLSSRPPNPDG